MFEFEELDRSEEAWASKPVVLHPDCDNAWQAASRSVDQLLWHGSADVAQAITVYGPAIGVLPLLGQMSGIDEAKCLAYSSHPQRAARCGFMDLLDFETKFGHVDPQMVDKELNTNREALDARLPSLSDQELQNEVLALQDWRSRAEGRLRTLERRAAWAVLGVPAGSIFDKATIRRAFKKRALEMHPDKGGDAVRFQLLQEMKEILDEPAKPEKQEEERKPGQNVPPPKKKSDDDEDDDESVCGIESDSSYDADEEFKKMFPRRRRKKKQETEDDVVGNESTFERSKYEIARQKLHRSVSEIWERTKRLTDELRHDDVINDNSAGEPMRQLRSFLDRFERTELSKLTGSLDGKKGERIFRRFIEQGSELLCAAAVADTLATLSDVAMKINYPLLAMAPPLDASAPDAPSWQNLRRSCAALLEAITNLPKILEQCTRGGVQEMTQSSDADDIHFYHVCLLTPASGGLNASAQVVRADIDLPHKSLVRDLRARVRHVLAGRGELRLFCGRRFLGNDHLPLADLVKNGSHSTKATEETKSVPHLVVQCLPSNKVALRRVEAASYERCTENIKTPSEGSAGESRPTSQIGSIHGSGSARNDGLRSEHLVPGSATTKPASTVLRLVAEQSAKAKVEEKAEQENASEKETGTSQVKTQELAKKMADDGFEDFFASSAPASTTTSACTKETVTKESGASDDDDDFFDDFFAEKARPLAQPKSPGEHALQQPSETCQHLATVKRDHELGIQRLRTAWQNDWSHPCAGTRREDGSGIFCFPCDTWIDLPEPFDHVAFERHCEKVGHYGWID